VPLEDGGLTVPLLPPPQPETCSSKKSTRHAAGIEKATRRPRFRTLKANKLNSSATKRQSAARICAGNRGCGVPTGKSKLLAVVVTVMVALLPADTEEGSALQAAAFAVMEQLRATLELKPLIPATAIWNVAEFPAVTVALGGCGVIVKSGPTTSRTPELEVPGGR
jgi:hypothetical protein